MKQKKLYKRYKLKNGLEVVLYPMNGVKAISVFFGLIAGASNEPKSKVGTLHFLEHMLFQGSNNYKSASEFMKFGESIYAKYNGAVSNYDSTYWYVCPSSKLHEIIKFISDFLINPAFREEDIEKTRSIIISEISDRTSSSDSKYFNHVSDLLFGKNNPYVFKAFGTVDTVKKITRADLLKAYKKYYKPENIKLVLAGGFDKDKAEFFINKYFSGWESASEPIVYPKIKWTYKTNPRMFFYHNPRENISCDIIFPCLGFMQYTLREWYLCGLVNYLVGKGPNSVMSRKLRDDLGLVYSISCDFSQRPYAGFFGIYTNSEAENTEIVLRKMYEILREISRKGFREEDFVLARNYINMHTYLDFSDVFTVAGRFFEYIIDGYDIHMPEDSERLRNTISLDEINSFVSNIINSQKARLMMFGNKNRLNLKAIRKDFLDFCRN